MEELYLPYNRGGALRKVDNFPTGYSNDGIYGYIIGGKKYIRQRKGGVLNSMEVGIYADGSTSMAARINTVCNHPWVRKIEFSEDSGGDVFVDADVNAQKVMFVFHPGTRIRTQGAGKVRRFKINAGVTDQIFAGTKNVEPIGCAGDSFSACWMGLGNGVDENGVATTQAAQVVIKNLGLPRTLYAPPKDDGTPYFCSTPILLYNWTGTDYGQTYIEMFGSEASQNSSGTTTFTFGNKNTFGIGIQQGKGVVIKGITIQGPFNPGFATMKQFVETKYFDFGATQNCRADRYSPNAGVLLDPFSWTLPPVGTGYSTFLSPPPEGQPSWYRGTPGQGGSTACKIVNCNIREWMLGVGYSINGRTQNCDSMQIHNCNIEVCRDATAYGQDQTKNCKITGNNLSWDRVHTYMTNLRYGNGTGCPPAIEGISFAGTINQLANCDTSGRFGFSMSNVFAESLYRIGTIKGQPTSFNNFAFNFTQADYAAEIGAPDYYGNIQNLNCKDGVMRLYDNYFDKRLNFFSGGGNRFDNIRFDRPPIFNELIAGHSDRFENCSVGSGSYPFGGESVSGPNFDYFANIPAYGRFTTTAKFKGIEYHFDYDLPEYEQRGSLGFATVTVNTATRKATVVLPSWITQYLPVLDPRIGSETLIGVQNLYLYHKNIGDSTDVKSFDDDLTVIEDAVLGRIIAWDGATNTATLSEVPTNITTRAYLVQYNFEKYLSVPFVADSDGTTTLSVIENQMPFAGQILSNYTSSGTVTAINAGAKTATASVGTGFTATDIPYITGDPIKRITSFYSPSAGPVDKSIFVIKGTKWYSKEVKGGVFCNSVYCFTKSGYLDKTVVGGATRQAEWIEEFPTRVNPVTHKLEFQEPGSNVWTEVSSSSSGSISDVFNITGANTRAVESNREFQIYLDPSTAMKINIGTTGPGSFDLWRGDDPDPEITIPAWAAGETVKLGPFIKKAGVTLYFSGQFASGTLSVAIIKTPLPV